MLNPLLHSIDITVKTDENYPFVKINGAPINA
jgi:hypothetical protein